MKYGGFFAPNRITLEKILELGKQIDDDLACGKRTMADLKKDEKKMLIAWRKSGVDIS